MQALLLVYLRQPCRTGYALPPEFSIHICLVFNVVLPSWRGTATDEHVTKRFCKNKFFQRCVKFCTKNKLDVTIVSVTRTAQYGVHNSNFLVKVKLNSSSSKEMWFPN